MTDQKRDSWSLLERGWAGVSKQLEQASSAGVREAQAAAPASEMTTPRIATCSV